MKISNSRIEGLEDLKGVAAHELVHVLQGQYYFGGTAGNVIGLFSGNRWFIEAAANYYAALAVGMDSAAFMRFIAKDGYATYLSQPITIEDDNSM